MSQTYARVVAGKFTAIRYSDDALRFGNTIASIIGAGDEIYPVIEALPNTGSDSNPQFRDPTPAEIANKVVAVADLARPLYNRDLGVAGGVATLDEHGDVPKTQIPDEVVEYLGTWDPRSNTPTLANGVGNIGDSYKVADEVGNDDFAIDLGDGEIYVRGGMTIIYRAEVGKESEGEWYVQGSSGLSDDDRFLLENSLQNKVEYQAICTPSAPAADQGDVILAQMSSPNNPYPEYSILDKGGLSDIQINAYSGELRVNTTADTAGTYKVVVLVGGQLGQTKSAPITVTVNPAAS